jgi:hypothetical protein
MVFKVFSDFFMYKSGIYSKHPDAILINKADSYHSVKILGWGSEKQYNGEVVNYWVNINFERNSKNFLNFSIYFCFKLGANSWGDNWGEVSCY